MRYCKKCRKFFSPEDAFLKCPICNKFLKSSIKPDDEVFFIHTSGEEKDKLIKAFKDNNISYTEENPAFDPTKDLIESGFGGGKDIFILYKDIFRAENILTMVMSGDNTVEKDYLCENSDNFEEIAPVKSRLSTFLLALIFLLVVMLVVLGTDNAIAWLRELWYGSGI